MSAQYREGQGHALSSPGQLLSISLLLLPVRQLLVILNQLVDLWKKSGREKHQGNNIMFLHLKEIIKKTGNSIVYSA